MSDSPTAVADGVDAVDATVLLSVLAQVKGGDFGARMPFEWTGVAGKVADGFNDVIIANEALAIELARVSRVVGKQGELSQRLVLGGASWSGSVESVNSLIDALVRPTSEMQRVIGAVADGDLSKKVSIEVRGEMLDLKNTINAMVDQLNGFISEVTRVAREVGTEGKLGGQAQSKEVAGVWKDLTDNVNQLAANLTNQVRAISDVATAVTEGDLTRQVTVEASGEVAVLKDKLNEMIRNLRETTTENIEQDWLKTNRERFTRMLQGQRDLATVSNMILSELAPLVSAQHAVFYSMNHASEGVEPLLELQAGYGFEERRHLSTCFRIGEGLVGQCAKEKKRILLTEVPGDYVRINSGLGAAAPLNIIVLPILFEGSVRAVIELASFSPFSEAHQAFLDRLPESIGLVLNTIEADTLTENLLKQSQSQAEELRSQQEELRESNEDLGRQASLLAEQNLDAERKNQEVEQSKRLVEEKAGQLAVSSKYKSEFIANMSHELRTPLNSLLILAEQLQDDPEHTMSDTQIEYAGVILNSGKDLLSLLNSILELAKVESGTIAIEFVPVSITEVRAGLLSEFAPVAERQQLAYSIELAPGTPETIITDPQRLGQILKNLLANAFKFTPTGDITLKIGPVKQGWSLDTQSLNQAERVIALAIRDTGIGIVPEHQHRVFEAFAQGDGTTSRVYGGTGLGLSISRELAHLLHGEITLTSNLNQGSTFTIYLPTSPPSAHQEIPTATLSAHQAISTTPPAGHQSIPPGTPATEVRQTQVEAIMGAQRAGAATDAPVARVSDYVPAVDNDQSTSGRNANGPSDHKLAGTRVLVVDDDFRNVFALTALLERAHAVVMSAESGSDAVGVLERCPEIEIVLMDIMMPIMDGYTAIRTIRAMDQHKTLPIIAVTGKVVAGERERCLDAGANDYVPKPVNTIELLTALQPWLPTVVRSSAP